MTNRNIYLTVKAQISISNQARYKMKKLALMLSVLLISPPTLSNEISNKSIMQWLGNKSTGVKIVDTKKITLENGESAILGSVESPEGTRNSWATYVLARPSVKKAILLENYGGQTNSIKVLNQDTLEGPSIIVVGNAESGQGHSYKKHSVISIDGWNPIELYTVEDYNNLGDCGDYSERECEASETFIDISAYNSDSAKPVLIQTRINHKGQSSETMKAKVSTTMIPLSIVR